jgi:hypothetical protein
MEDKIIMSMANLGGYGFSQATLEKLGSYVYCLGYKTEPFGDFRPFYIGKGVGNRVFAHVAGALKDEEDASDKNELIRKLTAQGIEIKHYIIRHGMSEREALSVECALIDFVGIENLTNQVSGHGSSETGMMTVGDIETLYAAKPADIVHPVMIININKAYRSDMDATEIYEATRKAWKVGQRRDKAKYALAAYKGICRGVFKIQQWKEIAETGGRQGFDGDVAEPSICESYLDHSLEAYIVQGAQNPIKYVNC